MLPGQTVNIWQIPTQLYLLDGQPEPAQQSIDYLALDARDRFPDRPTEPASNRKSHRAKVTKPPAVIKKPSIITRNQWLTESIGRLQTAVADQCITALHSNLITKTTHQPARPKTLSALEEIDINNLPSLSDMRRSQSQFSNRPSPRSPDDVRPPRSHFGSRSAPRKGLPVGGAGIVKEFSNPFLAFSESRQNSTTRRPSLTESLRPPQPSALKHTSSWSEGVSDGDRAVR